MEALKTFTEADLKEEAPSLGGSFKLPSLVDGPEKSKSPEKPKETPVETVWLDEQSIADQAEKYPETTRCKNRVCRVFDLSDTEDAEAYNDILQRAVGCGKGLTCIVYSDTKEFYKGTFYACVTYSDLQFKRLMPDFSTKD
jgi:hypothetical protein